MKVVETVAEDLDTPWGLAPLPGGDLLVSSRDTGKIFRIAADSGEKTEIGTVPGVAAAGEGGLLGIAVPKEGEMVYAYLTTASDNRIVRMLYSPDKPEGRQLGAPDTVFKGIPKGAVHNGGRIAFGPDGMLWAGTGESGEEGLSQDKDSPGGKILRMTPDGEPARGNPDPGSAVYSWGHRNVQGLAWDAEKRLWASEFGQNTWDELNLIEAGKNYGWPEVEGKGAGSASPSPSSSGGPRRPRRAVSPWPRARSGWRASGASGSGGFRWTAPARWPSRRISWPVSTAGCGRSSPRTTVICGW